MNSRPTLNYQFPYLYPPRRVLLMKCDAFLTQQRHASGMHLKFVAFCGLQIFWRFFLVVRQLCSVEFARAPQSVCENA